jgi:hypothetical protein
LKKYSCPEDLDIPARLEPLKDNSDLLVCKVERLFYNCDYHMLFKLSSGIIKADPYHARALPIHIAFHQQALVLSPLNLSTFSALGYVQTLTNDLTAAVESFHKALGISQEKKSRSRRRIKLSQLDEMLLRKCLGETMSKGLLFYMKFFR